MKTKKIDILAGCSIDDACKKVLTLAQQKNMIITFTFNDQNISVSPNDSVDLLIKNYMDESTRRHEEYINSPEYKKRLKERKKEEEEKIEKLNKYLKDAPTRLTLKDELIWNEVCNNNTDSYGNAVIKYAETWARLLEVRIANGENLQEIADECSHIADIDGITGFMYGCAVSILSSVWIYGEELKEWNNKR